MQNRLELPKFETRPQEILESVDQLIDASKKATAKIAAQVPEAVTFESTLGALDALAYQESLVMSRVHLLQNVSHDEEIRKIAAEASVKFQEWAVERAYDAGVYRAVKAFAATKPSLSGEDKKIFDETLRDFKRLGLDLPAEEQSHLKTLQKKLSSLETEFSKAINDYHDEFWVDSTSLTGLSPDFVQGLQTRPDGKHRLTLQYPDYLPVMEFCENESLRKEMFTRKMKTAAPENSARINQMISLRDQIAARLGYGSWNEYVLEERMAKKPETVTHFLEDFEKKLKVKAESELQDLRSLKADHSEIKIWEYAHLSAKFKKLKYDVDLQALKSYFPLPVVLNGMLRVMEKVFSLTFTERPAGSFYAWDPQLQLYEVKSENGEALGCFYLDLYPREGKYGHAAVFGLKPGKLAADGIYDRPVACMVCNFSEQLTHSEVETLFHEFGHVLHHLVTRAKYSRFSGTSVAWDFVEAPSQVLENWASDPEILDAITPEGKKISRDLIARMEIAKKAGAAMFYLRQVSFAKSDLAFHSNGQNKNADEIMYQVSKDTFLALPEGIFPAAGFGHMVGYASGYYGYSWSDVMAADIFSIFRTQGLLDRETGLRMRREIYEPGSSRDELESLLKFLGRPLSDAAFFQDLGLEVA